MSYRIAYDTGNNKKYFRKQKNYVLKWVIGICIAFMIWFAFGGSIQKLLLPGDPVITQKALATLLESLNDGEGIYSAVQAFCGDILQGAGIYE